MAMIKKYSQQIALACIYLIIIYCFKPGFMSFDSFYILGQSISLNLNNWHPPVYILSWSVLNLFSKPLGNMLLFQIILSYLAFAILLDSYKKFKLSWLILFIPILPWILNFSGVIWKDILFSNALILTSALWLRGFSKAWTPVIFCILIYIVNLRWNGIFAVIVFVYLLFIKYFHGWNKIKVVILSILTCLIMASIPNYFLTRSFDVKDLHPSNAIFVDDLFRISMDTNNYQIIPLTNKSMITDCDPVLIGESNRIGKIMCLENASQSFSEFAKNNSLFRIWALNVFNNPYTYFKNRLLIFEYNLRIKPLTPYYVWHPGIIENEFGIKLEENSFTEILDKFVNFNVERFPILFLPSFWLVMNIFCLALLNFKSKYFFIRKKVYPLLISSLIYSFSYLILGGSADYRYYYYLGMSTTISIIVILIERFNEKPKVI